MFGKKTPKVTDDVWKREAEKLQKDNTDLTREMENSRRRYEEEIKKLNSQLIEVDSQLKIAKLENSKRLLEWNREFFTKQKESDS